MKKLISAGLALFCYALGIIFGFYFGIWKMLCLPLAGLYMALVSGELTIMMVVISLIQVLFSTTLAGLIWCVGYIGFNYFRGTEDPDWSLTEEQRSYRDSTSA